MAALMDSKESPLPVQMYDLSDVYSLPNTELYEYYRAIYQTVTEEDYQVIHSKIPQLCSFIRAVLGEEVPWKRGRETRRCSVTFILFGIFRSRWILRRFYKKKAGNMSRVSDWSFPFRSEWRFQSIKVCAYIPFCEKEDCWRIKTVKLSNMAMQHCLAKRRPSSDIEMIWIRS